MPRRKKKLKTVAKVAAKAMTARQRAMARAMNDTRSWNDRMVSKATREKREKIKLEQVRAAALLPVHPGEGWTRAMVFSCVGCALCSVLWWAVAQMKATEVMGMEFSSDSREASKASTHAARAGKTGLNYA